MNGGGGGTPRQSSVPVMRVITRLNIGGPARQALLLTRALEPDFETTLVAGVPAAREGSMEDPSVPVLRAPLVRPISPSADLRALVQLGGLMARTKPAIVHTHMAKAGTIGRTAARLSGSRAATVHTYHGHVLEGYFSAPLQRGLIAVERALARSTDALIAVSHRVRDELLELGIGKPEQYRVIRLGFDLSEHLTVGGRSGVLRERLPVPDGAPLLGMVGRIVAIKDHHTALRAVAALSGVHLVVAGDGPLRPQVEQAAATLGIADRVHFTGWVTDIPSVMADLDVALLTSRNEGTPVALIEAAACGVPAVATDVGGVAEVVTDGVTGLLVPAGDPAAVATAVSRLIADPDLRAGMGREARTASGRFTSDRLVGEIRTLYNQLAP